MNQAMYLPIILVGVLLNAAAQLCLKQGMNKVGHFAFSWQNILPIGQQVFLNPYILLGLFSYVVSVVVWLLALSRVDVSYAYPMLSIGYIVNAVAAYLWLHESLSMMKILGIAVIMLGVYLMSRT
jgi:drug/metabolite transporter (DMT)-like permease